MEEIKMETANVHEIADVAKPNATASIGVESSVFEEIFEDTGVSVGVRLEDVLASLQTLHTSVLELGTKVCRLDENTSVLPAELARLRTDEQVLNELHSRLHALSEESHMREVLMPIFLGLICLADRCTKGRNSAAAAAERYAADANRSAHKAVEHLRQSRDADRIEVENILANFDVVSFENSGPLFNPEVQRCVERIPTIDAKFKSHIARRVLPGYRRNGRVIRQEWVAVYVNE
jgi:hypothetical protein